LRSPFTYLCYMAAYHTIITRPEVAMLNKELPVLVRDWGITSCKLFMTYASLQLRDNELLDVMMVCRRNSVTTVRCCPIDLALLL
jgi:dihydropyrimidinase